MRASGWSNWRSPLRQKPRTLSEVPAVPGTYQPKNGTQRANISTAATEEAISSETPTDILDRASQQLNQSLANDIYQQLLLLEPATFERLIRQFIVQLGYGVNKMDGLAAKLHSADKGIDGIVWQDALGLDRVYLQAKRYSEDNKVEVQKSEDSSGALDQHRATKGIFITTSSFTPDALQVPREVVNKTLLLIDGLRLAELMVQYDVGVQVERNIAVKKVDRLL